MEGYAILNIVGLDERDRWNSIVKSFHNWDVYYLQEYAQAFYLHGDGVPFLIDYQDSESRFCYVVMKSDIADAPQFCGILERGKFYDLETPYGYGGPLSDSPISEQSQRLFLHELKDRENSEILVSQFVRFHPLLMNHNAAPLIFETRYLHDTIFIDTASPDLILTNMDSKNRNMVRKAKKNGVIIEYRPVDDYQEFIPIYEETMRRDHATAYYYFGEEYFRIQTKLKNNACFFFAMKDDKAIAAAMIYYNEKFCHYHLAGTAADYRKYAPSNLLLYETATWASRRGITKFHLGGGITQNDSLYGFKKQFNRNGRLSFVIGRTIFNKEAYQMLLDAREKLDHEFDRNNNRMIQYRA